MEPLSWDVVRNLTGQARQKNVEKGTGMRPQRRLPDPL